MAIQPFQAPKVTSREARSETLVLNAVIAGGIGQFTFVCGPIPYAFKVKEIIFASVGIGNSLYFMASRTDQVYTSAPPADFNIMTLGGEPFTIQDFAYAELTRLTPNMSFAEKNLYLKVHVDKTFGGGWTQFTIFVIEEILEP